MNCERLNQDIAELQTLRARFARKVDELNDTMRGKIEARKIQEEVRGLEDQILESYLMEFREKYPELFRWRLEERIDGFVNTEGYICNINSIASLPDGEGMLVGGDFGALCVYRKDEDGVWRLGEEVDGFHIDIHSIAQLPDGGGMLVGGDFGILYICRKDEDGVWRLGEEVDGFVDAKGNVCDIETITPLPDGEGMLVGGSRGELRVCRKDGDGKWRLGEEIGGFKDAWGDVCDIETITPLPDGEGMLVGGSRGELRVCRKNEDGKWRLGEEIKGLYAAIHSIAQLPDGGGMLVGADFGILYICRKDEDGVWKLGEKININRHDGAIRSIAPLPDGEGMLVGGFDGIFYECYKGKNGKWKLGEKIDKLEPSGELYNIGSIAPLPDGEGILMGGAMGALYEASRPNLSIDTIKQNFDSIIERGGA